MRNEKCYCLWAFVVLLVFCSLIFTFVVLVIDIKR